MTDDLSDLLRVALSAANAGGQVLRRYWYDGVELRDKSAFGGKTYDLVSDADLESQAVIANLLSDAFPSHELMGEEDLVGDLDAEHLWVIDPLDGTNNFAHRIPHFAVSIAHYRSGIPVVGVVVNPMTGDIYSARLGQGATHNGQPIGVSQADSLSQSLVGCGFYYDRGEMMRRTLTAIEELFSHHIHGLRRMGTAALDLCAVASGQFGAFFEYKLSPWDFGAGQLIVTEAGGTVTDGAGKPLGLVPSSLVASNGRLHEALLDIVMRHHPGET
ncbi:inositol monophosphatase [Roseiconus nitratireducens]|uniref:Inositol-1-monophosphatase n=1 Tax=Roseiconus nitratireducens TaxID=2605748 RepID=A0A5M6CZX3_9BACT|nr:inositol monophosphatase family protein [Roseiconus nitratireducens]KAA5539592.1 inositol monophosphatase [Roseiconus nitratireducens]